MKILTITQLAGIGLKDMERVNIKYIVMQGEDITVIHIFSGPTTNETCYYNFSIDGKNLIKFCERYDFNNNKRI